MPKTLKYDYSRGKQINAYYRLNPEKYGASTIWFERLHAGNNIINVEGKNVVLPCLNLSAYYPGAEAYAFIEKIDNKPIIMIDVLYTYEDITQKLESDGNYLEDFLLHFSRIKINMDGYNSPALVVPPKDRTKKVNFTNAMKKAIEEERGKSIIEIVSATKEIIDLPDEEKRSQNVKENQDNIMLELARCFYDAVSLKPIKNSSDEKKVKRVLERLYLKKGILLKSGAMIIFDKVIGKYYVKYSSEIKEKNDNSKVEDTLSIYIENVDDYSLQNNGESRKTFGEVLFSSNILETFSYLNANRNPTFMFSGKYNESIKRLELSKEVDRQFDMLNDLLVPRNNRSSYDTSR